ncbi:OprO/OprP family phosphate-selective porin [Niveispirillum fermenti]|uniref:OprO/OprP family phosphate-selective porin n=1 Tax=Niveispirillum fermenti TaxID=1233113 RepID=UPI003A89EF29
MSLKSNLLAGAAVGAAILVAGPAAAQTAAPSQAQIDTLSQQIQALQSQLTSLKDSVAKDSAATKKTLEAMPRVTADGGRIRIQSADKKFDAAIRARIHMDYGFFNAGKNFTTDATDGFQMRRAFLGVAGKVYTDWAYEFTANFADNRGGGSQIQAANIAYTGFKDWTIIGGVLQPKFTLDDSTSSNDIAFMERAPVGNIVVGIGGSDSRTGVGIINKGESHILAAYVTGNATNTSGTIDDQVNILGRAAYAFWQSNEGAAGIGVSGVYQTSPQATARPVAAGTATTSISFGDRPGLRVGGNRTSLTSTGAINQIDGAYAYGADLGVNFKSFWAAAEYYNFGAKYDDYTATGAAQTLADPEFSGYYVSAGYILTGERRNYTPGEWAGVKPAWPVGQNGFGAWEVATRFSQVDLIDRAGGIAGTGTGKETNWTLGVNWYVNPAIRFMLNHVMSETKRPNGTDVELDITAVRMQFQF